MFCKKCGKENDNDARFCSECGVTLKLKEEPRVEENGEKLSRFTKQSPVTKLKEKKKMSKLKIALIIVSIIAILGIGFISWGFYLVANDPNVGVKTETTNNSTNTTDPNTPMAEDEGFDVTRMPAVLDDSKYATDFDYKKARRTPDLYTGKRYKIKGKIWQAQESAENNFAEYRMSVDGDESKDLYFYLNIKLLKDGHILEKDYVTIYGVSAGNSEITTVNGDSLVLPTIGVEKFTISK